MVRTDPAQWRDVPAIDGGRPRVRGFQAEDEPARWANSPRRSGQEPGDPGRLHHKAQVLDRRPCPHSVWSTPTYEPPSGNIRRCGLPI
jgi:hypothetical protein